MKKAPVLRSGLVVGISLLAFLLSNCNSSSDKKKSADTSSVRTDTAGTSKLLDGEKKYLHTVLMTPQNFRDVFQSHSADNNIKMVYFELNIATPGHYSLRAFGANRDGGRETGNFDLNIVQGAPAMEFDPGGNDYLQQLTRGNVKAFLGLTPDTDVPIPGNEFKTDVWLVPCKMKDPEGNTLIYFYAIPANANTDCPGGDERPTTERGIMSTNPSPPGFPCLEECDRPVFKVNHKLPDLLRAVDSVNTH